MNIIVFTSMANRASDQVLYRFTSLYSI